MHIALRILIGLTFLFTAVINNAMTVALLQLLLFVFILMNLEKGFYTFQKSVGLLRWLVIPIIFLHAFFTPGELILSGMPVSIEGLQTGFWFALHLSVIFFSAILLSRLLADKEWIRVTLKLPVLGMKMFPYILLMHASWERIKIMLKDEYSDWRGHEKGMQSFVMHLALMPVKILKESHVYANDVWNNWDHYASVIVAEEAVRKVSGVVMFTATIGALVLWFIYLSGNM